MLLLTVCASWQATNLARKKKELKRRLLEMFERRQAKTKEDSQLEQGVEPIPKAGSSSNPPAEEDLINDYDDKSSSQEVELTRHERRRLEKAERKVELQRMLRELESSTDEEESGEQNEARRQPAAQPADSCNLMFEKLPAPTPPVFDGNILQYSDWKVAFDGLIGHLPLKPTQKFYYLKQYLSGKALSAVSSFFLTNTKKAYEKARKLLDQRFGDPYLLCREIQTTLRAWPKINSRDSEGLRDFADFLAKCLTLKEEVCSLDRLDDIGEILELTQKLPDWLSNKWNDKAFDYREKKGSHPEFEWFVKFLSREADKACDSVYSMSTLKRNMESTNRGDKTHNSKELKKSAIKKTITDETSSSKPTNKSISSIEPTQGCSYCENKEHKLPKCTDFMKIPMMERQKFIQTNRLCFGCLIAKHRSKVCQHRETCAICSKRHPTALHRDDNMTETSSKRETAQSKSVETKTVRLCEAATQYWSMIVPVFLSSKSNPTHEVLTYALLDTQSDSTFGLTETLEQTGGRHENTRLKLSTMTSRDELINSNIYKDLQIRGYTGQKIIDLPSVYSQEYIPVTESHIPTYENVKDIDHLKHVAPFIPPRLDCSLGLLIGYDCSQALLPRRVESGNDDEPYAIETDLGWSVVGVKTDNSMTKSNAQAYGVLTKTEQSVCFTAKRTKAKEVFVTRDILQILDQEFRDTASRTDFRSNKISQDDLKFMDIVSKNIRQDDEGYYMMPLPLKINQGLPDNRSVAEQRFKGLLRRFERDPLYKKLYTEFMQGLLDRGEAEIVPDRCPSSERWYLPHHGVLHPRKPGKIRVVWDCSSKYNGMSLNDILLQGPDMNNTLLGVLLRFRLGEIAMSCDIEKMFFQFRVNPEHRDFLRYLWFNENGEIVDYRMKVHVFGASSSPSCAIYGLTKLASDYGDDYPLARRFIQDHFYVDDGLVSTDSTDEAVKMAKQAVAMCKRANIRLCKFSSTSNIVLDQLPCSEHAKGSNAHDLLPMASSALGVNWTVENDEFSFRLELKDTPLSKRGILSTVSSIYDPLGLVAPILLQGKQILKEICGLDWDDTIPDCTRSKWCLWREDVMNLGSLKFPRCIKPVGFGVSVTCELHHFADASQKGYGCCSYLRQINHDGNVSCQLLMAKSRVTPSKITTVPRLELQAALLAVRLSKLLNQELAIGAKEFFYSDSEVVLGYLENDAKRFHTFVANRVQEIKNETQITQ